MATGKLTCAHTAKTRRRLGAEAPYLRALSPYPGGKRLLLPAIFGLIDSVCPRASWPGLVFADPFLGGGAVALAAKAQGFGHVVANDIAERSTLVGRALLANHRVRLTPASVLRLFTPAPEVHLAPPELLGRMPGGHRALLENAWRHLHGGTFTGVERDLIALLLLKWLFAYFPLGLPAATDAHRIVDGDFDPVTGPRLAHYLRRGRRLLQPSTLLTIADQVNRGIFPGTADVSQIDAFDFLPSARADIVYLDPPYGGTQSYEMALMLVDEFIGSEPPPPSRFSSRQPPLDELLRACSHIPVLVLSLGNSLLDEEGARALVARHRRVHRLLSLPYRHYGAVASPTKNAGNREFLILGTLK
jgi:16S rRNA G966 N2-methylase RsmD